jgi:hypothetical protein
VNLRLLNGFGFHNIFANHGPNLNDQYLYKCVTSLIERGIKMDLKLIMDSLLISDLMGQHVIYALVYSSNSQFLDHMISCGLILDMVESSFTNPQKSSIREKIHNCLLIISLRSEDAVRGENEGVCGLEILYKENQKRELREKGKK